MGSGGFGYIWGYSNNLGLGGFDLHIEYICAYLKGIEGRLNSRGLDLSDWRMQKHIQINDGLIWVIRCYKNIFELKRAWFEWLEGNMHIRVVEGMIWVLWRCTCTLELKNVWLKVQRLIWVQKDPTWMDRGCKYTFEIKRAHLSSKEFALNGSMVPKLL